MKKIAIVFLFFFLLSTGLILFFVSQTRKTQDIASQANEDRQLKLKLLINDCYVRFSQTCQPPGGLTNTKSIHAIISDIIAKSGNSKIASYKEKHLGADYPTLFGEGEYDTTELTYADMMTRLSTHTYVNYLVLFALMQVENNSFLSRSDLDVMHPFARSEESAFDEFIEVSDALTAAMDAPVPETFTVGRTTYQFEPGLNPGSKAVYSYLATTSTTPEIFERKVREFPDAWQKLYNEPALSATAFEAPPNVVEKPLPITPGEFPASLNGDDTISPATPSANVEDLF